MDTHVVIMAGGIGSRLWPVSTPALPKQFIDVLGVGKTLIQLTVERFLPVCPVENFWVVTSRGYVDMVRRQLPEIPEEHILAEPEARNTAPCIAYACRKIAARYPEANIAVTPSDALVLDTAGFAKTIATALEATCGTSRIVTVGISPSRPETGYGYIHAENAVDGEVCKVSEFREKPDLETAKAYLADGNFYWNAGIFIWSAATINSQIRKYVPGIASIMDELEPSFYTGEEDLELARLFPECEKVSIDYAVMEKSEDIFVVTADPGWSDLGSWGSVKTHIMPDNDGNSVVGEDVRMFGCKDCIVHAADAKTVVVDGLDGYIVAEKGGNILVCRISEEQHIKEFSAAK